MLTALIMTSYLCLLICLYLFIIIITSEQQELPVVFGALLELQGSDQSCGDQRTAQETAAEVQSAPRFL
jgi:hypothetical protein